MTQELGGCDGIPAFVRWPRSPGDKPLRSLHEGELRRSGEAAGHEQAVGHGDCLPSIW